jgi:prevent-host-death family protein
MAILPSTDIIGAYEAKTHFSILLEKVEAGEEFTITKHGTPVARLVPIKRGITAAERRKRIEAWINRPDKPALGGLKIRDLINEGRR